MFTERATEVIGVLLVILQFALLAVLGGEVATSATSSLPIVFMVPFFGGVLLGLWAVSANKPGNFNIRPVTKSGGKLVEHGPYLVIRHPMYLALILVGLGGAIASRQIAAWTSWVALTAVLVAKATLEEKALLRQVAEYRQYCAKTWRFLPWLF